MISHDIIETIKNRLIKTYDPVAIYLFGSHVWGTPHSDSDIDVMVVVASIKESYPNYIISGRLALADIDIPKDLLVLSQADFNERSQDITKLAYRIKHYGKIIYAQS